MAIANSYFNSSPITDSDIFVGTKYSTNRTVNYTAQSIADYLNINSRISISGQLTFKFTILPNVAKTIAFEDGGGDGRLFSSIDKLIVSILDAGGSNITVFLDYLVDGEILLAEQNQPNSFGHYKITSYTVTANPNFYELNLEYIGGNGNIYKDVYYDMTPWASSGGSGTIPSLDQVATVGNEIIDKAIIVRNTAITNYFEYEPTFGVFTISFNGSYNAWLDGEILLNGSEGGSAAIRYGSGNYMFELGYLNLIASNLTETTNVTFRDGVSGDVAFTSDITTPTLQQVTTAGAVTTDAIQVGGITAGNFVANGIQLFVSDNFDSIYNFQYIPYSGLYVGDGSGFGVLLQQDCSISFVNATAGGGNLRSDLLTGYRILQLPDGDGTLALTTDMPTATSQLTNDGSDGVNPFITLNDIPPLIAGQNIDIISNEISVDIPPIVNTNVNLGNTQINPYGTSLDSLGNIYVCIFTSNNVTKITPLGVTTILGTTGANPIDITIDSLGNVYTANLSTNNVSKITPSGVSTILGNTGSQPVAITIDSSGNIYTANQNSNNVTKITPSGVSTVLGTTGNNPRAIAIDSSGNVYTANNASNNVSKITQAGVSTILGTTGNDPTGIVVDSLGNVYTSNFQSNNVTKITSSGTSTILSSVGGSPRAITIDFLGNIYTANSIGGSSLGNISKITPSGVSTILGNTGETPISITTDSSGSVYTTNAGSANVTKITIDTKRILAVDDNLNIIRVDGSGSTGIPTLQEVLDNNHDLVDGNFFVGTNAGDANTGNNVNAFGSSAGSDNTFNHVQLFGQNAQADEDGQTVLSKDGAIMARISTTDLTASRKYTLPDATGTIALTSDIPSGSGIQHATASGTDTYTATIAGVTSYADADAYLIRFTNGNTTGATLNINSLGARPLYRNNDGPLLGGDVGAGGEMLCVYNSSTNVFQCIGTSPNSLFAYVTNDDSVAITKGMPVYAFGGTGDRMTVKRANNSNDSTSAQTVGLVLSTSIAPNQKGFILMQGLLDGLSILPTATWSDGDAVYLGETAGTITNVKPYAPKHLVYLGTVTTASNGTAGRLYVRVQNGFELQELHNVDLISNAPTNNQLLTYESATSLWKNKNLIDILENFNRTQGVYYFQDFLNGPLVATIEGIDISTRVTSGGGGGETISAATTFPNRTSQQGVLQLTTGTSATGQLVIRVGSFNSATGMYFGNGEVVFEAYVNVETLSTAAQRFADWIGWSSTITVATAASYQFIYDEGGVSTNGGAASSNWKCCSFNGTTRVNTDTGVPVVAGQWYKLRIVVNAANTQINYLIDGTNVATHTSGVGNSVMAAKVVHTKSIGTTNRTFFIDYLMIKQIFTTPR